MSFYGNDKEFNSFLAFLDLRKTSQPGNTSELSTDYDSRKRRKADELSVGGILSVYLLPCNPYGNNHLKQREFEVNALALVSNAFTSLSLVDHACFRNLTQDINPCLCPVGCSKLSQNLIPAEN